MDNQNDERDKLRRIQTVFEKAVKNNSMDDLKPYVDPDFSYVSFTDRSFSDFDTFSKQWSLTRNDMVGPGSFSTNLNPEPTFFAGDTAVCYGNSSNNMIDKKGQAYKFSSHWTVVFKRKDGDWKVLRAHNSINPFANPMLNRAVKMSLVKFSALGFISGVGLCYLLTYLI